MSFLPRYERQETSEMLPPQAPLAFGFLSITLFFSHVAAAPVPISVDTSSYYRLTNDYTGSSQALGVRTDGSGKLGMVPVDKSAGQYWQFVRLANGPKYALRSKYLGDAFSLDVVNDNGVNSRSLHMTTTGHFSGQFWTVTPWGDGSFQLTNDFTGPSEHLDVYSDTKEAFLDGDNHSGQHWHLTKIGPVIKTVPVPALTPVAPNTLHEGPTDYSIHPKALGKLRAVMIFVDFADTPAQPGESALAAGQLLTGHGSVAETFLRQSYNKLDLAIDVRADLNWRRMPPNLKRPTFQTNADHRAYITAALSLYSKSEIDFSTYAFVMVVPPRVSGVLGSGAFSTGAPGTGIAIPGGEIRFGITFGEWSYGERPTTAIHEIGHVLGLPDLYPYAGAAGDFSAWKAGSWDIMADTFVAQSFTGWHRHKLGWLAADRKTYLRAPASAGVAAQVTLTPLGGDRGVSVLVMDLRSGAKVLVAEVVQPMRGRDGSVWGKGVLVYTVDARVPSGSEPIELVPKGRGASAVYDAGWMAPWGVGDTAVHQEGGVTVRVRVVQRVEGAWGVEVQYSYS